MCGIVGYVGARDSVTLLIDALKRLEYRGYDSCGIAFMNGGAPTVLKAVGRIVNLEEKVHSQPNTHFGLQCGIAHTRWATHGKPTEGNAHPHHDCNHQF